MSRKYKIAIIGAGGYTGAELIRLLHNHPSAEIVALGANSHAGHVIASHLPIAQKIDEIDFRQIEIVFCCLPHGTSQAVIASLPSHLIIIDLSADFRLKDPNIYRKWYGEPYLAAAHLRPVYGLSEHYRNEIAKAQLIACPGCYPTATLLPLLPLIKMIDLKNIVINAISGVSGAGKSLKTELLFAEVNESAKAYAIGNHRHIPEIEQELSGAAGEAVRISFTPHLIPMSRGMLATISVICNDINAARNCLINFYADSDFVKVTSDIVATKMVVGTNKCLIAINHGNRNNELIITSVIDNLTKGASGQAVQNMNIRLGIKENLALDLIA